MECFQVWAVWARIRFFFDGARSEEDVRREEAKNSDTYNKFQEFKEKLTKEVTISKEKFIKISSDVVSNGDFVSKAIEHDPKMGFVIMLTVLPIIDELAHEIFDKEDKENGRE